MTKLGRIRGSSDTLAFTMPFVHRHGFPFAFTSTRGMFPRSDLIRYARTHGIAADHSHVLPVDLLVPFPDNRTDREPIANAVVINDDEPAFVEPVQPSWLSHDEIAPVGTKFRFESPLMSMHANIVGVDRPGIDPIRFLNPVVMIDDSSPAFTYGFNINNHDSDMSIILAEKLQVSRHVISVIARALTLDTLDSLQTDRSIHSCVKQFSFCSIVQLLKSG
ncbi:hypothetical protein V1514DRAFT_15910 [Lipomyces japonicus]|uniref:uncharacterized protein n=1 Tax=Lipomyces japonicus TaxID=56871 RepID=UPI0034CDB16F